MNFFTNKNFALADDDGGLIGYRGETMSSTLIQITV